MRRQKTAILIVSFVIFITALSIAPVLGSTGGGITQYTITNTGTGTIYRQVNFQTGLNNNVTSILAGDDLSVAFTISANLATGADLKVSTSLDHSTQKQVYWEVHGTYAGLDTSTLNPNQNFINFKQTSGSLQLTCYGSLSASLTTTTVEGTVLHKKAIPTIITLTGSGGQILDIISIDVIDSKIAQFQNAYSSAQTKLSTYSNVDPAYTNLYRTVLTGAQVAANQGFVDSALLTVNSLNTGVNPQIVETPILATLFIPVVAGLAVVAVIAVFLFTKARGKSSYYSLIIEDQIKDLEGLTMRAARVDRSLASNLEGIKERLQQLVGT